MAVNNNVSEINCYPNPTRDNYINIELDSDLSSGGNNARTLLIEIYDMNGTLIMGDKYNSDKSISLSLPSKGLFIIRVSDNGQLIGTSKVLNL